MPDQVTNVTKVGLGKRLGNSFGGIFIGILLFLASFVVLFWNEGRVDISTIASQATHISATEVSTDAALEGSLVSMTGTFDSESIIGDDTYLKAGNYIALDRNVEMYAWEEKETQDQTTNLGGSETIETTYSYNKVWTEDPQDSDSFYEQGGHANPSKSIQNFEKKASQAQVGVYSVDPQEMGLPASHPLVLADDLLLQAIPEVSTPTVPVVTSTTGGYDAMQQHIDTTKIFRSGQYIFVGKGTLSNPVVGDMRISYEVLKPGLSVTAFGALSGDMLDTYTDEDGNSLYRAIEGSREDAIEIMHTEYTMTLWLLRLVGFFMMLIGLSMVVAPLHILLDILPFLGSVSRTVTGLVLFLVSLVLTAITIIISQILHSLIAVLVTVAVIIVAVVIIAKRKKKNTPTQPTNM